MTNRGQIVKSGIVKSAWAVGLAAALLALPGASLASPNWHPEASERLIKLPSALMARSIERDFATSALAEALNDTQEDAAYKAQTLRDLKAAAKQTNDSEVRMELRHQYLAAKRDFIGLMGEQHELQRKRVEARQQIYQDILGKLERSGRGLTPQAHELLDDQLYAQRRFVS